MRRIRYLIAHAFPLDKYPDAKVVIGFWKSTTNGQSANGGAKTFTASPGLYQQVEGPLELCGPHALHATLKPNAWSGDRTWIVALFDPVIADGDKMGSLQRVILEELT